jgi:two-component system sensor kinase FixL
LGFGLVIAAALALMAFIVALRRRIAAGVATGEAQYRAIFNSSFEAMAVIDARGVVQSVNPSVERTFGYAPAELIGRNITMVMPGATGAHQWAIVDIGREVIGRRKDGSRFPLELSVAEWQRAGKTYFTGAMRDVSERKDSEDALRVSEESLRLLQIEFAHFARVNDLGEMAAAISHEINQPLTAIVNYLNTGLFIALEGYSEDGFVEAEEMMRKASEQALRAGNIVRRLREFVGKDNGERTVERAERLVDAAIALALIDARSSGIAVNRREGADEARVEVDVVQIQQVLVNLLRNAVEAMRGGPSESGPGLTIATASKPGVVEISVADNGPGIEPAMLGRLFEPFVTTKTKGLGMGLSVCRRLIEAHGGTIEAQSEPGCGATFRVTLPQYRSIAA